MKFLLALCIAAVALTQADIHADEEHDPRTCGVPHVTQEELANEDVITDTFVTEACKKFPDLNICPQKIEKEVTNVCLWIHIIYNPTTNAGNVPDRWIQDQLAVFNSDFGGTNRNGNGRGGYRTNFQFHLEGVTRTGNALWFNNIQQYEAQATAALAVDPCRCQQVYFSALPQNLLGYCYLPNSFAACSTRHGCFNDFNTMPGGNRNNYNLGQTVTHEVGHGFGLLHVFQGGVCTGCGGDQVCDTNPQRTSTSGCPASKDSCGNGRQDNINNFLDYSTDICMNEFTRGQSERMDAQIAQFRPGFIRANFKEELEAAVPGIYRASEYLQSYNEAHPKLYGSALLNATATK